MTDQEKSISIPLRYRPDEITITSDSPFQNDKLNREPFVTATTNLLRAIPDPFVIALNAPWGSGKTTTLRLLEPNLKKAGITTVSFNAWEIDDATDPLVPLVAALHDRFLEIKGYAPDADNDKIERWKKVGSTIAKHTAIVAVKAATAGLFDIGAAANGVAKAVENATEEAEKDLANDLIDAFKKERQAAQQFHSLLEELISHVRSANGDNVDQPPVVLIIDELDRCRPTFAVAMLERIKHFFNVPGLVFVLSLDLEQLKASTHKVYGAELDATEYLRRFIDLELRLPQEDNIGDMVNAMLTNCGADAFFSARQNYGELREDRQWIVSVTKDLAMYFELSPRIIQRMISRLMLVLRQTPQDSYLDPVIVVFMIFLRVRNEQLLKEFMTGRAQASNVMDTLRIASSGGQAFYDSDSGIMIEAYLLRAHQNQYKYVEQFLQRATELVDKSNNRQTINIADQRTIDVARRYEHIRRANYGHWG
ncbi:MAG: KAP family NTPase, partial [Methylobacillus sp.]|nr:KAP family NTPase [Methylobacillus sp.]